MGATVLTRSSTKRALALLLAVPTALLAVPGIHAAGSPAGSPAGSVSSGGVSQVSPPALAATATRPAAAVLSPGAVTLRVQSARTVDPRPGFVHEGDPVTTYHWMINQDDTGDPGTAANQGTQNCLPPGAVGGSTDPDFADGCQWPSIRYTPGWTKIIAQGDQTTLGAATPLPNLPGGRYLISVTADGFKIDGEHFTVDGGTTPVTVRMNPTPLPLGTIRIQVYQDQLPVDATYEADAERGLPGFTAHLTDVLGNVSVDYYGNPICTAYQHTANGTTPSANPDDPILFDVNGKPVIDQATNTGRCTSDATGQIVIPNMGPDRYGAVVTPPAGQTQWVQTTTLEGSFDHDIWVQEGDTGYDNEMLKGGEPVPMVQFGFAEKKPTTGAATTVTGAIKGTVVTGLPYVGGPAGVAYEAGLPGTKVEGPLPNPWIAVNDLNGGDASVYVGQGNADGTFTVPHVPDGSYQVSVWDQNLDEILYSFNVVVANGQTTDAGNVMVVGWFTHIHGFVFLDSNGNGKRDPGEPGIPQFPLTVRERDNSLIDQGAGAASTGDDGSYDIKETYPLGKWLILEGFDTRYQTTGVTYRGDNEKTSTTKLGSLVDLNFLPIIGLSGEVDWGVKPLPTGTNGGIAGTVTYDTTRNELDPRYSVTEDYQPGIPGVPVDLYAPVPCPSGLSSVARANQCNGSHAIVPLQVPDGNGGMKTNPDPNRGAFVKASDSTGRPVLLSTYTSETWDRPRGCTAYDFQGDPLTQQRALPEFGPVADRACVESPMMGVNFGASDDTPGNAGQTVNGNYSFTTSSVNQWPVGNLNNPAPNHDLPLWANLAAHGYPDQPLRSDDYIVQVEIPDNPVGAGPMYRVTSESDVNIFQGDAYLPQQNFSSLTPAEAAHPPTGATPQPVAGQPPSQQAGIVAPCAGALHTVHVTATDNPSFLAGGGSPFEGQDRPSCQARLVTVRTGQTVAPNFQLFTTVPVPTHFWGLTINDLGLTHDLRSANYGEAQGIPNVPVGLYDYAGRLVDTVHTDFNGMYEALEPSTDTYNCPVPAGPCPNMYRFVGNDPGQVGALNPDYNPRFRTISATFQGWPGLYTTSDEAPTQVATTGIAPDGTAATPTQCDLGSSYPQLFAVDKPVVTRNGTASSRTVTLQGVNFGATRGSLTLGSQSITPSSWTDTQITFTVPAASPTGALTLRVTRAGLSARADVNGLSIQVTSGSGGNSAANPAIFSVGPGRQYSTVQSALDAASSVAYAVVAVYPGAQTSADPRGEYTENLIVHSAVHLQGVGPGGFQGTTFVPGSILDGLGFNPDNAQGAAWVSLLGSLRYSGTTQVPDGAVITVVDNPAGPNPSTSSGWVPSVDGFTITGGVQLDTPTNLNTVTGGTSTPYGATGALITQGGGVYVHANVHGLQVTDNVITGNSGSYGGGIRVGTPYTGNANPGIVIARNQIRDNGGTNLAGGVGLFRGSNGYQVTDNAICGNFSSEYGGAVSAFGYMGTGAAGGGTISRNRIWFNGAYDEGGGVMVAGELPADPAQLSEGSGPVNVEHNVIAANMANDDGGGIRLLMTSGSHISPAQLDRARIADNSIVDNVSAHEGGGISLDDAVFVDIVSNTIAKNLTTATAITSTGQPAPAGLSTAGNSDPLQSRIESTFTGSAWASLRSTYLSKPIQFNDLYSGNRAGSWNGYLVDGIGTLPNGYNGGINEWDMGTVDVPPVGVSPAPQPFLLDPTNTVLQSTTGTSSSPTNRVSSAPGFVAPYDLPVDILPSRTYPAFRQSLISAVLLPPSLLGDYHLTGSTSPAFGRGTRTPKVAPWGSYTVSPPTVDIDGQLRPTTGHFDAGSDQVTP